MRLFTALTPLLWKVDPSVPSVGLGLALLGSLYPQEAECETSLSESKQEIHSECYSSFLALFIGLVTWP